MYPVLRAHIDICQEPTAGMVPQNLFVCGSAVLEVLAASLTGLLLASFMRLARTTSSDIGRYVVRHVWPPYNITDALWCAVFPHVSAKWCIMDNL